MKKLWFFTIVLTIINSCSVIPCHAASGNPIIVNGAIVAPANPLPIEMGTGEVVITNYQKTYVRKETSQNLASGPLAYTTNFAADTRISHVLLHASTNITETITIYFNSLTGANYDTLLIPSQSLLNEANLCWIPDDEFMLLAGDEISITCTNNNLTGTVYVTVVGETIL